MSINASTLRTVKTGLDSLATTLEGVENVVGGVVSTAATASTSIAASWSGQTPEMISGALGAYVETIGPATSAVAEVRRLVGSLATTAGELADRLSAAERTLATADVLVGGAPVQWSEDDERAFDRASATVDECRTLWHDACRAVDTGWGEAVATLTSIVDAQALPHVEGVPTHAEYVRFVVGFAATTTFSLDDLDPSGELQAEATDLHQQLAVDPEEQDPFYTLLAAVIDVAKQGDLGQLDGNWSSQDLEHATDPERVRQILHQLNEEQGLELTDEMIDQLTERIVTSAWLLRADDEHDWEDLDPDDGDGWVDWTRKNLVGPVVGTLAGVTCVVLSGPESGFLTVGGCIIGGNAIGRAVGAAANGGSLDDMVAAAYDPQALALDGVLLIGTVGAGQAAQAVRSWMANGGPRIPVTVINLGRPVWHLNPFARGQVVEEVMGGNLSHGYPRIDIFDDGYAVSIKTIDLGASSYANPRTLARTIDDYIESVAGYNGGAARGSTPRILPEDVVTRGLTIVVPPGATPSQVAVLGQAIADGAERGVVVRIVIGVSP